MTRILSLWFPTLPTDHIARTEEVPTDQPLVSVANLKGTQRIAAVDRLAADRSIRPGMSLADARAVCPTLWVTEADPHGDAQTLWRLLEWSRRFTPLAALDASDGLLLDISGVAHLFGGEMALIDLMETSLARQGFAATAAVADTPEAAWALARFGTVRIAPPGPAIRALSDPLPLAALRLDALKIQALAQAGLRRIGDVTLRPRAPIAARFGAPLFARLDGVLGLIKTPIKPCFPAPAFLVERRFAAGITRMEAVEASILALSHRLSEQLTGAGLGARRVEALFFRVDGVVKRIAVGTSQPLRDGASLARLFHERLSRLGEDGLDTGYGFDLIRLEADAVEPLGTHQGTLPQAGGADATREAEFALLVDRLGARLGFTRVVRLHSANHHRPEKAAIAMPAFRGADPAEGDFAEGSARSRPLRLFDRPEPIEALASVPDGPPVKFRWRRADHHIAAIEGPERIAAPWWTDAAPVRDYFQAEDGEGRRFWLFREGLYGTDVPRSRWYLHGLFG